MNISHVRMQSAFENGRVAQWQSSGLLSRLLRVRSPPRSQQILDCEGLCFVVCPHREDGIRSPPRSQRSSTEDFLFPLFRERLGLSYTIKILHTGGFLLSPFSPLLCSVFPYITARKILVAL